MIFSRFDFSARVARDALGMWDGLVDARPINRNSLEKLPLPVRRYLLHALGDRERGVRTARLRHDGTFRTKPKGRWMPIQGKQYFSTDPPGFVWWGRVRMFPGLWVDAHDRSVRGGARMFVQLESAFTLADSAGPELDESALQRLLGELVWLPPVFLDERYVIWSAIDDARARATLRVEGREAVGTFEFGDDGLPTTFSAERYRDVGGGKAVRTLFTGECSDYRLVEGLLVPHRMNGYWDIDGERLPFVRFRVRDLDYDVAAPFEAGRSDERDRR